MTVEKPSSIGETRGLTPAPFVCPFRGIEGIGECDYARHATRPECWSPGRLCPREEVR